MSTFIERTGGGTGLRVAVKDLIDVAGLSTTAGCRAVADAAVPAAADAACLAGLRAAVDAGQARIVGKTNLDELAAGASGVNPWFGTPVNPLDAGRVPGGSSSGSAVAVAGDEADVAIGTDTGGSVRIPAACCGVTALKTTWGRIPREGVFPLSQSLDTVGPLARDVAGVTTGMRLLEPGFAPATPARTVARVRLPGVDPVIDAAIDAALAAAELEVIDIELPGWGPAFGAALGVLLPEAWANNRVLLARDPEGFGAAVTAQVVLGRDIDEQAQADARRVQREWQAELDRAFARAELLATPTLSGFAPLLEDFERMPGLTRTMELNLAGVPALAQPVRTDGPLPASLQLIAPHGGEEILVATGARVEAAAGQLVG